MDSGSVFDSTPCKYRRARRMHRNGLVLLSTLELAQLGPQPLPLRVDKNTTENDSHPRQRPSFITHSLFDPVMTAARTQPPPLCACIQTLEPNECCAHSAQSSADQPHVPRLPPRHPPAPAPPPSSPFQPAAFAFQENKYHSSALLIVTY